MALKSKTTAQRNYWHDLMQELAREIGDKVEDHKDPATGKMAYGLKSKIKMACRLYWTEDRERTEMLYEGLINAAEAAQKVVPNLTPCEFLVMARTRIIDAPIRRRSSETYSIEEYSVVIDEVRKMYFDNGLVPPHEPTERN